MDLRRWERLVPLLGILAVALWVLGAVLLGEKDLDTPEQALEYYRSDNDENTKILLGGFAFQLGALAFIGFLGRLRSRFLAADGGLGALTSVAFASGIATAIFLIANPGADMAAALSEDDLTGDAALALGNLNNAFFIGAEVCAAGLMLATALLALGRGALPRWLGWLSLLIGIWLLIAPIGWAGLIVGFPLWTLVVAIVLWREWRAVEPAVPPTAAG